MIMYFVLGPLSEQPDEVRRHIPDNYIEDRGAGFSTPLGFLVTRDGELCIELKHYVNEEPPMIHGLYHWVIIRRLRIPQTAAEDGYYEKEEPSGGGTTTAQVETTIDQRSGQQVQFIQVKSATLPTLISFHARLVTGRANSCRVQRWSSAGWQ